MKKLMFAAALVASAAAFADGPINAVDFEGVNDYQPNTQGGLFYFDGDSNSSFVSNDVNAASADKRTAYFAETQPNTNAKYLALDTEGGTLWRSINTISESETTPVEYGLGEAQNVADTGTYLDTLVQFTVTEDEEPEVNAGDKLAIWLQAGVGTTNLMVKAKAWALDGGVPAGVAASFTVSNVAVAPGEWYRLTVKAVQTVIDPATGMIIPAFQIFIDGTEVAATTPQISTEMQSAFAGNNVWLEGMAALASANKLFPTLAEDPAALTDVTLKGVGFQGTGAVDEIVWTEENPFPAAGVNFTLTYSGDANVTALGAVTYTVGDDPTVQTPTEGKIPEGATVSIAAPTFAAGYQLGTFTVGGTAVASPSFPYTFTMTADTTVAITSAQITYTLTLPPVEHATPAVTVSGSPASGNTFPVGTEVLVTWTAESGYQITAGATQNITMNSDVTATAPTVEAVASYPTYVGDDATLQGQYNTWKSGKTVGDGEDYEKQFLLNTDPSTTVADDALQIDSITENATAGWDIVVSTTVTGAALSDGSKTTYNGYLLVKAADTLAGLATATPVAYPVTAVTGGKVSITVTSGKFMKVELTTTAPAQN